MVKPRSSELTLVAVGDMHPNGRDDRDSYFDQCGQVLQQADIAFCQFEGVISPDNSFDAYTPQPTLVCKQPEVAETLANAGFDILSLASNKAMDGGSKGLLDTTEFFSRNNIRTVGAGLNLKEARSPVILERKGRRIAFLATCSVMPTAYEAGPDRPGVAPLRASSSYEKVDYQPGTPPLIRTTCDVDDLQALTEAVKDVRAKADIVVVSCHFGVHLVPEYISGYEEEAAHAVIDAGADLVLGHHPHILKGIEVYKGKVIFYSLGNFCMDHGKSSSQPVSDRWFNTMKNAIRGGKPIKHYPWFFLNEVDPEGSGGLINPDSRKTMVAKAVIRSNEIERVSFLPAILRGNVPQILTRQDSRAQEVLDYVKRITRSQVLEASFAWDGDEVVITP